MQIPMWAWIVWLVVTIGSFAALQAPAVLNRIPGDTLSENLRRWLGIKPPDPRRRLAIPFFLAVLIGFVAWFAPHIVLG